MNFEGRGRRRNYRVELVKIYNLALF